MTATGANTEEDPDRLENDDIQDIQASTFQYGVVKTQQQLMAENPYMNGDMYAEATIGEKEIDENNNGIPDDEEDRVGTFLNETVKDFVDSMISIDDDQRNMDDAFSETDRDIFNRNSRAHKAVMYVQQRAPIDPEAQHLLDNYNATADTVQSALDKSRQSPSADNFLALKVAELDRSMAKADMVKYDASAHGNAKDLADAQKWHDSAQTMRDKLADIQKLPADQQQAALDKLIHDDPHSRLAGEWKKFKSGDLSKWQQEDNRHLTADGPDYSANNYQPQNSSNGSSSWSLSSIFGNWAMPWSSSTPATSASSKPVAAEKKSDSGWSLSSVFGNWAMPWSSSQPASSTATKPAVADKKTDSGWSLTSVFSHFSMPWSTPSTPAPDQKQATATSIKPAPAG